jgi:hypothetical protein
MDKPSKRRLATDTLSSKEDMKVKLNRKLPKRGTRSWVPVESAPLTEEHVAPVEVQPTPAPTFDRTSNVESQGIYPDEGYDYGARYGDYQATHFNSTLVNDEEADGRAEWLYHQRQSPAQTAGYVGAYSAPYSGPSARSRGFRAPFDDSERESQASPALDCIERIMGRMERQQAAAASALTESSAQLHALIGQGEFLFFSIELFEMFEICSFSCIPFHRAKGFVSLSTLMESIWAAPFRWWPAPYSFRLSQRLG